MSISALYRIWRKRLKEVMPVQPYAGPRLGNLVHLVVGMYQAGSIHLNHAARKVPLDRQKLSIVRRFRRLLSSPVIQVREWYAPVARSLLAAASTDGEVQVIVDSTKVTATKQLVMVAVAYHRRALPVAWTWVPHPRGHSTMTLQLALLSYVRTLVPPDVQVIVVGDSEFGHTPVLRQLEDWNWQYVLRQRGNYRFALEGCAHLSRLDEVVLKPGDLFVLGDVYLTASHPTPTHMILYWKANEKEPWLLATNIPCVGRSLRLYKKRMWIEELFGDLKGHGFDLEHSRLQHGIRLSRLTLLVVLLYLWLVAIGEHTLVHGLTHLVDRSDRRDLSIFRLGCDFLERCLILGQSPPSLALPTFALHLSGG